MRRQALLWLWMLAALGSAMAPPAARSAGRAHLDEGWPQYASNPFIIKTGQPSLATGEGSINVSDVNGDGLMDYLYTAPGSVGAYDHWGRALWVRRLPIRLTERADTQGLPGLASPGIQVGDVDGDGRPEAVFVREEGAIEVLDAGSGRTEKTARPPVFGEVRKWEACLICNLRGKGDRDVLLQAGARSPSGEYVGRYLQAHALERIESRPLWRRMTADAPKRGTVKVADLDGDGRDEVIGSEILGPNGAGVRGWRHPPARSGRAFRINALFVADVRPEVPGLEVVMMEEGRNCVALVNMARGVLWHKPGPQAERPHTGAIGDFDPDRPGLEIWCRSLPAQGDQSPWVFDAQGRVIAQWITPQVAPPDWSREGVEGIWPIDWDGSGQRYCAAKERHREGGICVFDPMTGRFLRRWADKTQRILVADVSGDAREEIIVAAAGEIHIYWNDQPNPHAPRPRYWAQQHYRRAKANSCFYAP